jgi:threonine aldolase
MTLNRRQFLGSASLPLIAAAPASIALAQAPDPKTAQPDAGKMVSLGSDMAPQTEREGLARLQELLLKYPKASDSYLGGGAVGELEKKFSALLGKEDTVFMPTGTLANQIAIRLLCGEARHALVQQESHVYRDESNAVSTLSNINMVPLAGGRAAPGLDELREAIKRAEVGPYPIKVGAIALESPVRRASGETLPKALVADIARLARSKNIPMHLDGARLFFMCGADDFKLNEYCEPFDTVYVSLYKYLGAGYGGILSGTRPMMARARELRHVFGGTLYHAWQAALPALDALDGAEQRFATVRAAGERLLAGLDKLPGYKVKRVENGSNIAFVDVSAARQATLQENLRKAGIRARQPVEGRLTVVFNETILRRDTGYLLAAFAAGAA